MKEIRFRGASICPAMIVRLDDKDEWPIVVLLRYMDRMTSIPRALSRCGKKRKIIVCTMLKSYTKDESSIIGRGLSFCRPPDRFSAESGCRLAFHRAVYDYYSQREHVDPKGSAGQVVEKLWEQFIRTKAWRRLSTEKPRQPSASS